MPSLAVISVGEENTYGHPVPDVLKTLEADRVATLRTDRDGTVSIVLDGNGWRVESGE
jgi:competence protein ComEC